MYEKWIARDLGPKRKYGMIEFVLFFECILMSTIHGKRKKNADFKRNSLKACFI